MKRVGKLLDHLGANGDLAAKKAQDRLVSPVETKGKRKYTWADIEKKREEGLCWIVIHKKVYDVTEFLEEHPGGAELIEENMDDLEEANFQFDDAEHSEEAMEDLEEFYKGKYVDSDDEEEDSDDDEEGDEEDDEDDSEDESEDDEGDFQLAAEDMLTPFANFQELDLPLVDKVALSHDVCVFRFALPTPEHRLGLPNGEHVILSFPHHDGSMISRPYTPVSPKGEVGFIDFLIKLYPTGKMSHHLSNLEFGTTIKMRGPKDKLTYFGNGDFLIRKKRKRISRVGMIAGGSGITPMFQIIQAVATDEIDDLDITLLFANKTEADIILRDKLEEFSAAKPNIKINYTLDKPPPNWTHQTGFITKDMISSLMPEPSDDMVILLCGPPPMIKKACVPALQELGYTRDHYFKF